MIKKINLKKELPEANKEVVVMDKEGRLGIGRLVGMKEDEVMINDKERYVYHFDWDIASFSDIQAVKYWLKIEED